jgi:hypothetical protein
MPYFWQLAINPKLKIQTSIISFGYVDSYAKIFLILYPPLENSTTCVAILWVRFGTIFILRKGIFGLFKTTLLPLQGPVRNSKYFGIPHPNIT